MGAYLTKVAAALTSGLLIESLFGIPATLFYIMVGMIIIDLTTGIAASKICGREILSHSLFIGLMKKSLYFAALLTASLTIMALDEGFGVKIPGVVLGVAMWAIGAEFKSIYENISEAGIIIPKKFVDKINKAFNK